MSYAVLVHPAAIAGVSLNGINDTVFDFLDNTGVIGLSVLRTRRTLVIPIKENNHSGDRLGRAVNPLSTVFEPLDAIDAACKLGNNSGINVAALVGAPRYKAGTPFHTAVKTVPRPVRLTAHKMCIRDRFYSICQVKGERTLWTIKTENWSYWAMLQFQKPF